MPDATGPVLDHVAVALEHWAHGWDRYAVRLGGRWRSGGLAPGFAPAQLAYANDARVELLMPWESATNPFLRRFLDASGPGPHHLTFKVPGITAAIDAARALGYEPVGINTSDPEWKEAFLHPKQAPGIVVQIAQAAGSWHSDPPEGFPIERAIPSQLCRAVHVVVDLPAALDLFSGLLGGRLVAETAGPGWTARELAWPGPLRLRLVAPDSDTPGNPATSWLQGRPGRLHHLAFELTHHTGGHDPGPDAAARPAQDVLGLATDEARGALLVDPEENRGTRIVLLRSRL